jgi:hypothetical protein
MSPISEQKAEDGPYADLWIETAVIIVYAWHPAEKTAGNKKKRGRLSLNLIEGNLIAQGLKVGIAAARFNEFMVSRLVAGAEDGLLRHGVSEDHIDLVWVPGAFELPMLAKKMSSRENTTQ